MIRIARVIALIAVPALLLAQPRPTFPHADHASLFPTCVGCHAGVPAGNAASLFPSPTLCAKCHNGDIMPRVDWQPPAPRGPGLLAFSHPSHLGKAKDVGCESCHSTGGDTKWMNVARAAPRALHRVPRAPGEHAPRRRQQVLHLPSPARGRHRAQRAARSGVSEAALARGADFASAHGTAARATNANCATCHAKESCARCHVDANRSTVIRALGSDHRVAHLVAGKAPSYPTPADHPVRRLRARARDGRQGERRAMRDLSCASELRNVPHQRGPPFGASAVAGRARGRHARRPATACRRSIRGGRPAGGVRCCAHCRVVKAPSAG